MRDLQQHGEIVMISDLAKVANSILIGSSHLRGLRFFHKGHESLMGSRSTEIAKTLDGKVLQVWRIEQVQDGRLQEWWGQVGNNLRRVYSQTLVTRLKV